MEEIRLLLQFGASPNQKIIAANTIITNYDLPFNADNIIQAFLQCWLMYYNRATALMHLSLTTNVRMFIAIIYALLDNKILLASYVDLVTLNDDYDYDCYILGCRDDCDTNVKRALQTWSALYNYYEFDISALTLSSAMREGLQQHIDSTRVARYTKPAIK